IEGPPRLAQHSGAGDHVRPLSRRQRQLPEPAEFLAQLVALVLAERRAVPFPRLVIAVEVVEEFRRSRVVFRRRMSVPRVAQLPQLFQRLARPGQFAREANVPQPLGRGAAVQLVLDLLGRDAGRPAEVLDRRDDSPALQLNRPQVGALLLSLEPRAEYLQTHGYDDREGDDDPGEEGVSTFGW